MNTRDVTMYMGGQLVAGTLYSPNKEPEQAEDLSKDDLPAVVSADRAEFTGTLTMTPEQAARMIELISPYSRDFAEAFHETVTANPKRWHIYGHTKRARIRNKQYKSFVTELIARMEAKAKARAEHGTL